MGLGVGLGGKYLLYMMAITSEAGALSHYHQAFLMEAVPQGYWQQT